MVRHNNSEKVYGTKASLFGDAMTTGIKTFGHYDIQHIELNFDSINDSVH